MKQIFEKSRFVSLIAIVSLLASSVVAFFMAASKTVYLCISLVEGSESQSMTIVRFIQIIDISFIATALYIFSAGLYELFIGKLEIPEWMSSSNIYELEAKLANLIILIMAGKFLENLVAWEDPQGTMFFAIAIAIISSVLIAFGMMGKKNGQS